MLELAGIVILGILAQWMAWKFKVPAILPLILTGLFFGPVSTLFSEDGGKWIEPLLNSETGNGLFPSSSFFYFVSLSIGIILFEGGLTLKRKEIKGVSTTILKLISLGSAITFIGGGILAHFIMDLNWPIAFLFSGLIIVTGPTVIAPILRNLPIKRNVATVLKWEGILIDPIGALVAVLVFEFIVSSGNESELFTIHAIKEFGKIIMIGVSFGFTSAYFLKLLLNKDLIPHYLLNVFSLALVLAVFVASDELAPESGLLAVVVMGMVLGNLNVPKMKGILDFKESLSVLLISILFIVLSANIELEHLRLLLDYRAGLLFAAVIFLLRPAGVFLSTRDSTLEKNDKLFISWVGPRGIVAAGIASLFGMRLIGKVEGAEYITPLVFMVVAGTVLLNATTARLVAKWLNIIQKSSDGFLIVGANAAARLIGSYLKKNNHHVALIDRSEANVKKAKSEGLEVYHGDIYSENLGDDLELLDVGYLMALTPSSEVNKFAVDRFKKDFGENGAFRLITANEVLGDDEHVPSEGLFSCTDDFINLGEVVRDYPVIHELKLKSKEHFDELIKNIYKNVSSIPLFLKDENGKLMIIPSKCEELDIKEGDILVYIGREIEETHSEKKD